MNYVPYTPSNYQNYRLLLKPQLPYHLVGEVLSHHHDEEYGDEYDDETCEMTYVFSLPFD